MLELKFLPILHFPTLTAHCHDRFQTNGSHSSTPLHHRRAQLPVCRLIFTFLRADHVDRFHFSACSSPTGVPRFSFSRASKRITHSPQFNYSSKQGEVACQVEQHDVSFLTSVGEENLFWSCTKFHRITTLHTAGVHLCSCHSNKPVNAFLRKERNLSFAMMLITYLPFCC